MAKYGRKASEKVEEAMHERKEGTLRSGRSGKKVTSRKQAIAIGLSEARRAGAKVPPPKKKTAGKTAKTAGRRSTKTTGRRAPKTTGRNATKTTGRKTARKK
jgi:hypothetical protein